MQWGSLPWKQDFRAMARVTFLDTLQSSISAQYKLGILALNGHESYLAFTVFKRNGKIFPHSLIELSLHLKSRSHSKNTCLTRQGGELRSAIFCNFPQFFWGGPWTAIPPLDKLLPPELNHATPPGAKFIFLAPMYILALYHANLKNTQSF